MLSVGAVFVIGLICLVAGVAIGGFIVALCRVSAKSDRRLP